MPWRRQKESPHSRGLQAIGSKHEIRHNEGPEGKHLLAPLSVSRGIRGIAPSHIVATDMPVSVVGVIIRLYTVMLLDRASVGSREIKMGNPVLKDLLSQSK